MDAEISGFGLRARIGLRGAELLSLADADWGERVWQRDPRWWERSAPTLFPVIGRLPPDARIFPGAVAPMPLHGLAPHLPFAIAHRGEAELRLELQDGPATRDAYPHAFRLQMTFRLEPGALVIESRIENRKGGELPYAFGFHPGFSCPPEGATLLFECEESERARRASNGQLLPEGWTSPLEGRRLDLTLGLFAAGALVFDRIASRAVTLRAPDRPPLTVLWDTPNLGIWSKPGAPYLCIEPWAGLPPGQAGVSPGLLSLFPNAAVTYRLTIAMAPDDFRHIPDTRTGASRQ